MSTVRYFLFILACALLFGSPAEAQSIQQETTRAHAVSPSLTVIIEKQKLRFAALASAQEVHLVVSNQAGGVIYDSGLVSGPELSWALRDANGGEIPSGLYVYTLTIKETGSDTPATRRGHVILERGRDQIWVTNQGALGTEDSLNGESTVLSAAESANEVSVAGARIGRAGAARSTLNLDFFGTPGRIPMFTGSDILADSVIAQDFNGRIGIGTQRPGAALLTVAGQIESTSGGIKFPNGSVQTSAGLSQVVRNPTLTGNGTEGSPLGVNIPALNLLSNVVTNPTLSGNGTSASPLGVNIPALNLLSNVVTTSMLSGNGTSAAPLGVASPLILSGPSLNGPVLRVANPTGAGIVGAGGNADIATDRTGVIALGGNSSLGVGGDGILAISGSGATRAGFAGIFAGNVAMDGDLTVNGTLSKGAGSFRIDHPLDPANKYLYHSFVESPDMKNIYDGTVTTDQNGDATVTLPDYFEALNRDFRYQLTVIGQFAQAIVASKISGNSFTIKTDRPGVEVSWQVTGIRQDAYANKRRIPVEEKKPERERGYYLHPQVFNQPEEKSLEWARNPELMLQIKSRRQEAEIRRREKENDR